MVLPVWSGSASIKGERGWLWRAVDDAGEVLDILVQRRRSALAAKRFFRKLLKGLRMVPCAIGTDRLASYAAAKAVVMPTVSHLRGWRQNNRVENSHQPVRQRERGPSPAILPVLIALSELFDCKPLSARIHRHAKR